MQEVEPRRRRRARIPEAADVVAKARTRIAGGQAGHRRHVAGRELREEARAGPAAADLGRTRRLEIAFEQRPCAASKRRLRRKAVEHRHVLEHVPHPVAIALAMAVGEHLRDTRRVVGRVAGAQQAARDLRRCAAHGFRVQRVAAEEIDLLQLREQARARVAAGGALEFLDRQEFARVEPVRVELGAAVEVTGYEQHVARHAGAARRTEPIGAARAPPARRSRSRRRADGGGTSRARRAN